MPRVAGLVALVALASACAGNLPPVPAPAPARYPDFVFPAVPRPLADDLQAAGRHDRGWRFLQANDLRNAQREFSAALKRDKRFFPADAGLGYVFLAQKDYQSALTSFDLALGQASNYAPALVGRGDALLGLARPADALKAFELAVAADPSLSVAASRVQVLRLRTLQAEIANARRAADAKRYDEARQAYLRAIAASPDSAFLYRDLGAVERQRGDAAAALQAFRKAVSTDPRDARALVQMGELLEAQGAFDEAVKAYEQAAVLEPGSASASRLSRARERASIARMPAEFAQIAAAPRLTRGDLAALIGVHFAGLLQAQPSRDSVLITDTRGHWAAAAILAVVRAGILDVYANHTFQPRNPVRRLDLARAVMKLLALADQAPAPGGGVRPRPPLGTPLPRIADMPPSHLGYAAAAQMVTSGVMPLYDDETFRPGQFVSGEEALQVIDRVEILIDSHR